MSKTAISEFSGTAMGAIPDMYSVLKRQAQDSHALSREKEAQLVRQFQENPANEGARDALLKSCVSTVQWIAYSFRGFLKMLLKKVPLGL